MAERIVITNIESENPASFQLSDTMGLLIYTSKEIVLQTLCNAMQGFSPLLVCMAKCGELEEKAKLLLWMKVLLISSRG